MALLNAFTRGSVFGKRPRSAFPQRISLTVDHKLIQSIFHLSGRLLLFQRVQARRQFGDGFVETWHDIPARPTVFHIVGGIWSRGEAPILCCEQPSTNGSVAIDRQSAATTAAVSAT